MYYDEPPGGSVMATVTTSTDHGTSFTTPTHLGAVTSPPSTTGVQTRSGPSIAIDPTTGDIYAAIATYRPDTQASVVEVFTSHDHGPWSAPTVVAQTTGVIYFQPQIAIDHNGHVGLEAFELGNGKVNVVLFTSRSKGASFGPARTVTQGAGFDPTLSAVGIGDYQGLAAASGRFHPLWNDTRTGHLELFTATIPA
jgi:hypothetical protein